MSPHYFTYTGIHIFELFINSIFVTHSQAPPPFNIKLLAFFCQCANTIVLGLRTKKISHLRTQFCLYSLQEATSNNHANTKASKLLPHCKVNFVGICCTVYNHQAVNVGLAKGLDHPVKSAAIHVSYCLSLLKRYPRLESDF